MTVAESAKEIEEHLKELRREFHRHPETSRREEQTAARVCEELRSIGGFEIREKVKGFGVLADLKGKLPGKTVALRADMDALQIEEETGLSYASENHGVMHACGHDNHITMLLGAARLLAENRENLRGTVRFIFQPAEELSPEGGSRGMIEAGALDGVDGVFGIHVWPDLPLGKIGVKAGPMMAASDHFTVTIEGKSSHAAKPDDGIDALVAGAEFVTACQTIVSRNSDPMKAIVITIGTCKAGTRYNIVAGECVLEGTCRTFDPETRALAQRRLSEVLDGICTMSGCRGVLNYERGYMAVVNDEKMTEYVKQTAEKVLGQGSVVQVSPAMTAEDFSFYLDKKPGAFIWLGTTAEGEEVWPLHSCRYNPNEGALWRGAALLAELALEFQENGQIK